MIVGKADGRRYWLKLSRHIFDILQVESTRREESLRYFEVVRAQQKAEAVGREAQMVIDYPAILINNVVLVM